MPTRWERVRATFSLDLRSLAVLRMLLGGLLLVDLAIRVADLSAHYTDEGILPREVHERAFFERHPARFSLHMQSGELGLQVMLAAAAALCAVALSLGFHTRLALLGSLLLYISIQNRNNEIETGGDYLLRLVCFWCVFLPLGARWSLDRRAGRVARPKALLGKNQYASVASFALIVQMMSVYLFSALHKDHPIWTKHFTAIHYALHIDAYDTSFGEWLRQYPQLTEIFTRVTLVFEWGAPWLLVGAGLASLLPGLSRLYAEQAGARTLGVLTFVGFHLGLGASLSLGTFAWFAALLWLGFFPKEAWDEGLAWLKKPPARAAPLAVKVLSAARALRKSEAEFRPPWTGIRARLAAIGRRASEVLVATCLVVVVGWNIGTVEPKATRYLRGSAGIPTPDLTALIDFLRLDQHWGLFAPYPRTTDGYYVVLGKLSNGSTLDFLSPGFELTWQKPDDVSGSYKTFRWRKYFRNLRRRSHYKHRALYANYVCRRFNQEMRQESPLVQIEIYFMSRKTRPQGGHYSTKKKRIYRARCPQPE